MAISYVNHVSADTGNLTLTGVQEGDVCLLIQAIDGVTNSRPSGTTSWPQVSSGSNNFQLSAVYAHTVTSAEGSAGSVTDNLSWVGTTASTTALMIAYRGVSSINPTITSTGGVSTVLTYGALSLNVTDGTSLLVAIGYHRATNGSLQTPPGTLTNRVHLLDATDQMALHDGNVSSWSSTNVSIGGTSSGWRTYTIELIAAATPPSIPSINSVTMTNIRSNQATSNISLVF